VPESTSFRASLFASSGRATPDRVGAGLAAARDLGVLTGPVPLAVEGTGYLAGTDKQRRDGVCEAMRSSSDFAWAVRGGYGAGRLDPIDQKILTSKPLVGFSDVCVLLAQTYAAGGQALHGPVVTSLADADEGSCVAFVAALNRLPRLWSLSRAEAHCAGPLIGGNIEVLSRMIGTEYEPSFRGKIVVLEDVGEPMYRLDRALNHLLVSSDLGRASAVLLGTFVDCPKDASERLFVELKNRKVPVFTGAPVGHGATNHAFWWGESVRLDGSAGRLELSGHAVAR
jgi:muramoyltetrapeptide carboxypeptidase